jgi:hypothetical protein
MTAERKLIAQRMNKYRQYCEREEAYHNVLNSILVGHRAVGFEKAGDVALYEMFAVFEHAGYDLEEWAKSWRDSKSQHAITARERLELHELIWVDEECLMCHGSGGGAYICKYCNGKGS